MYMTMLQFVVGISIVAIMILVSFLLGVMFGSKAVSKPSKESGEVVIDVEWY